MSGSENAFVAACTAAVFTQTCCRLEYHIEGRVGGKNCCGGIVLAQLTRVGSR